MLVDAILFKLRPFTIQSWFCGQSMAVNKHEYAPLHVIMQGESSWHIKWELKHDNSSVQSNVHCPSDPIHNTSVSLQLLCRHSMNSDVTNELIPNSMVNRSLRREVVMICLSTYYLK